MSKRKAERFKIKSGDTFPHIVEELRDGSTDQAWDLTGATVQFHLADENDKIVVNAPAYIVNAAQRIVGYDWAPGDTDELDGTYYAEWEVTFPGPDVATFPSYKPLNTVVRVTKELA